ncbi:MAG: M15 family metallopeptidase [Bacilli bacterium]|nr:M15 family metallopeptidase [Bacilli bacterium]
MKENNFEILVNKNNPLDKSFIPKDLIIIDEQNSLNLNTYCNYIRLKNEAKKLGYHIDIDSGYRSYEYQSMLYDLFVNEYGEEYASRYCALPGCSEHQTGLAIDINILRNNKVIKMTDKIEEVKWLHSNMNNYGFILRYPKDKEPITGYNYEPWHIRYVGRDIATYLYLNNLTLEEYMKVKKLVLK